MKLTSLSKAARTLTLMTLLSAMVGTSMQQSAQAQTGVLAKDNNGVCKPLPQGTVYQEFAGIAFSPAQKAAYRKIEANANRRFKAVLAKGREVVPPGAPVNIDFKPGTSDEKATEISDASLKMVQDNLPTDQQIKLLTQKYGRHARFYLATSTVYAPEVIAEGKRISRDLEARTMAILRPEQQKIYRVNLALQQRILACGPSTPIDRIISAPPY